MWDVKWRASVKLVGADGSWLPSVVWPAHMPEAGHVVEARDMFVDRGSGGKQKDTIAAGWTRLVIMPGICFCLQQLLLQMPAVELMMWMEVDAEVTTACLRIVIGWTR